MSAIPVADFVHVADRVYAGRTSIPLASRPRQRRSAAAHPAATACPVIGRIRALMHEHGITLSELGAAYAVSRIHALMQLHGITLDELRGEAPAMQEKVPITRCPSMNHDPRYQLPPGARVVGPFTTEWNQLRAGAK